LKSNAKRLPISFEKVYPSKRNQLADIFSQKDVEFT